MSRRDQSRPLLMDGKWYARPGLLPFQRLNVRNFAKSPVRDITTSFKKSGFKSLREGRGALSFYQIIKNVDGSKDYGVRLRADTAARVYFYPIGQKPRLVGKIGVVSKDRRRHKPKIEDKLIRLPTYGRSGHYFIGIHVQSYYYNDGGIWQAPVIEEFARAQRGWRLEFLSETFAFGIIFILTIYNAGLFLYRPEEKSNLWLAAFCFFVTLRHAFQSGMLLNVFFEDSSLLLYQVRRTIEFCTGQLLTSAICGFAISSFYPGMWKKTYRYLWGFTLITVCAAFALPSYKIRSVLWAMDIAILAGGFLAFYIAFKAVLDKKSGSKNYLLGFVVAFLSGIHDVLLGLQIIDTGIFLIHHGTAFMIFCFGQTVAKKFAVAFRTSERLSQFLEEEVKFKTKDIQSILDSIPQGILTICEDENIDRNYSLHLEEILGHKSISGRGIDEVLFAASDLTTEKRAMALTSIRTAIGEYSFNFDVNIDHLPTELVYRYKNREKSLSCTWSAVSNEEEIVYKILLAIRDVTELKAFEEENRLQKREMNMIEEIIDVERRKFFYFIQESQGFVDRSVGISREQRSNPEELWRLLFIEMHTLKGIARSHGFKQISNLIHLIEDHIQKAISDRTDQTEPVSCKLEDLRKLILEYEHIARHRLHFDTTNSVPMTTPSYTSFREHLEQLESFIGEIAMQVGKPMPVLHLHVEDHYQIDGSFAGTLNQCLVHLIRNSLDHGIEAESDRVDAGKPFAGQIDIELVEEEEYRLSYYDDGQGLNLKKLEEKVRGEQQVENSSSLTAKQIAEVIFQSGLSTAEGLTDISGRGVGMDAVRSIIERAGGTVELDILSVSEEHFAKFAIIFKLPRHLIVHGARQSVG